MKIQYGVTWLVTLAFAAAVIVLAENGYLNWGEEFAPGTQRMVGYRIEADAYIWLIIGVGFIWLLRETVFRPRGGGLNWAAIGVGAAIAWGFFVWHLSDMRAWSQETGLPWIGVVTRPPPGSAWIYALSGVAVLWAVFIFLPAARLKAAKRRLAPLENAIRDALLKENGTQKPPNG